MNVTTGKINDLAVTAGKIGAGAVTDTKLAAGMIVQQVSVAFTSAATGTTQTPFDDTIPQNTEGTEFMTLAITPKATTNILVIEVVGLYGNSASVTTTQALHQDTTADALAAAAVFQETVNTAKQIITVHRMAAGTTSATTFKVRTGGSGAGTVTFNGTSTNRVFGAITKSTITITEYKV